jgi:hypothetical protein
MSKIRFVVFTLLLSLSCASQTITCYSNQYKVFIKGYPNVLTVVSDKKVLEVTTDSGTVEKLDNNKYKVTTGDYSSVTIKVRTENKTEEFHFTNREPAPPILTFGGEVFNDTMAIAAKRFRVSSPGVWLLPEAGCSDISLGITEMTVIRIDKDNNMSREAVHGERSKLMALAEPGDTYIFMDVKIVLKLSPQTFQIPISKIKIRE